MLGERIKEMVDFATTQSPYRSANAGWINDDVYLQWQGEPSKTATQGNQLAQVSLYWKPINDLLSIVVVVLLLATTLVFIAVSFSHGKFEPLKLQDPVVNQVGSLQGPSALEDQTSNEKRMDADLVAPGKGSGEKSFGLQDKQTSPNSVNTKFVAPKVDTVKNSLALAKETPSNSMTRVTKHQDLQKGRKITAVDLFQPGTL